VSVPVRLLPILLVASAVLIGACAGPEVRTAPFRARPDAVDAGDLRGPFTGRVLDGATREPVAGALVYATWRFESGSGLTAPAGAHEQVGSTDAAGYYEIGRLGSVPSGTRLTDFHLVVYKRGFVAYRSDRRFDDLGPRLDFAQRSNQILLERWRDSYSHARHLRYIGGGTAVSALTAWEADDAAAELSGEARRPGAIGSDLIEGATGQPYLVAAQLLTAADIKAQTRYDGQFETGPLGDEPDTATYSSQHYKALGRPETWDVALRLWRLDPGAAQERYDELSGQLPGIEERNEIASRSFRALEGEIVGIAFLDGPRGLVVLLTCGKSQCATTEDATALGRGIHERIKALWPNPQPPAAPASPAVPPAPTPAPPPPASAEPSPAAPLPPAPTPAPKKPAPKKPTTPAPAKPAAPAPGGTP
jgi:hypothetical protein